MNIISTLSLKISHYSNAKLTTSERITNFWQGLPRFGYYGNNTKEGRCP